MRFNMQTTTIGIQQLHTKLKSITQAAILGRSFVVLKNSRPVFRIEPVMKTAVKKKYTLDDLMKLQFKGNDPDLSRKVDEIAYGV